MSFVYAGQYGPEATLDGSVILLPNRQVSVKLTGTATFATLYEDRAKTIPLANPVTIDGKGNLTFFTDPAQYDLLLITNGIEGTPVQVTVPIDPDEAATDTAVDLINTAINTQWFNCNAYGAIAGGDSSGAIQAAINACSAAGGGTVALGWGTYFAAGLTLKTGVKLQGVGFGGTTLKLTNGANTFLVESENFTALDAGDTSGGIGQAAIKDIALDGNKINQASGTQALVRLYGFDFEIASVRIRNARNTGLYTKWGSDAAGPSPDSMEAVLKNVRVHDCGGNGITWKGPHDSMWDDVITYSNAAIGMDIEANGGALVMVNCHSWGLEQTVAMYFGANVLCLNGHAEGAKTTNVIIAANDCQYYGSVDAARTSGASLKGIQIGTPGVGEGHEVAGTIINAFVGNCTNGAIDYVNDFGARVEITVFTTAPAVAAVGTKAAATLQVITGNATDAAMRWPVGFFYGQQMVLQTSDGSSLSVRTSSLSNKRTRQDFNAQGVDQWAWITDKDVANAHDIVLFDPINGRQLFVGRDDGTMELPRFYKRETVVASTPYTALISDVGTVLGTFVAGANIVTIPSNATAPFPIGTFIEVCQLGAGQTTLTPAGGVALRSPNGLKTRTQWSTVRLYKRDTNEWVVSGDTAP